MAPSCLRNFEKLHTGVRIWMLKAWGGGVVQVMQGGFKHLTPEEALIASKARGGKHSVCAGCPDFC